MMLLADFDLHRHDNVIFGILDVLIVLVMCFGWGVGVSMEGL